MEVTSAGLAAGLEESAVPPEQTGHIGLQSEQAELSRRRLQKSQRETDEARARAEGMERAMRTYRERSKASEEDVRKMQVALQESEAERLKLRAK